MYGLRHVAALTVTVSMYESSVRTMVRTRNHRVPTGRAFSAMETLCARPLTCAL